MTAILQKIASSLLAIVILQYHREPPSGGESENKEIYLHRPLRFLYNHNLISSLCRDNI